MNEPVPVFEQFQFGATRVISIILAILAWLLIAGVGLFFYDRWLNSSTAVSNAEVLNEIATSTTSTDTGGNTNTPGMALPDNLKNVFSDENRNVLENWLSDLNPDQRQDFISNLSQIAGAITPENQAKYVNAYKTLKMKKLEVSPFDKYARLGQTVVAVFAVVAAIFLIVLTGLALVLLQIERNTRASSTAVEELLRYIRPAAQPYARTPGGSGMRR